MNSWRPNVVEFDRKCLRELVGIETVGQPLAAEFLEQKERVREAALQEGQFLDSVAVLPVERAYVGLEKRRVDDPEPAVIQQGLTLPAEDEPALMLSQESGRRTQNELFPCAFKMRHAAYSLPPAITYRTDLRANC